MSDHVDVILRLLQARQFEEDANKAAKAVGGIGHATEQTGKQSGTAWKSIAKWGGVTAIAYGAQRFLRGAMATTDQLGQSTLALNRTTGMSIQQSSEWAATLQARGVATTTFQRSVQTLDKQMLKSNDTTAANQAKLAALNAEYRQLEQTGTPKQLASVAKQMASVNASTDKANLIWTRLGVNMADVRKGNTEAVLEQVSTAFSHMHDKAERAALAQTLFSRGAIQLQPLLFGGAKGIKAQLDQAGKYVSLNAKNAKQMRQEIKDQRELKLAYMGVQVSLGKALLPVLLIMSQLILKIVNVLQPFIRSGLLVKATILALVAAFIAWKLAAAAVAIADMYAALSEMTLNVSLLMTVGLIALVVLAIAGIVLAIIYAWKHFKLFRDIVYDVWNWIKQNWPLLIAIIGGPIGIVTYEIIKNFGAIKGAFEDAWGWVKKNWPLLLAILGGPIALAVEQIIVHFGQLKKFVVGVWDDILHAVERAWKFIASLPDKIKGVIKKIPGAGILGKALGLLGKAGGALGTAAGWVGLQGGGTITRPGVALVGEAGPEILRLPVGAQVLPLSHSFGVLGAGGQIVIRVPVFLDRRQIAEAMGSYSADQLARR